MAVYPSGMAPVGRSGPTRSSLFDESGKSGFWDLRGWPSRHAVLHFRLQLVFQLMRFIAHQLRAHEDMVQDVGEIDHSADIPPIPSEEQSPLPARWDEPWDSDDDPME